MAYAYQVEIEIISGANVRPEDLPLKIEMSIGKSPLRESGRRQIEQRLLAPAEYRITRAVAYKDCNDFLLRDKYHSGKVII